MTVNNTSSHLNLSLQRQFYGPRGVKSHRIQQRMETFFTKIDKDETENKTAETKDAEERKKIQKEKAKRTSEGGRKK